MGTTWTGGNNRNQRHAGYAQDRWNLNARTTLTLGLRWDYQRPYYLEGKRDPIIKDILPASVVNAALIGKPMFEAKTYPESAIITRNSFAPRLGVSYDVTGQGKTVLKGFYGRFYYNYADAFSALNPSGANYKQFKFNDVNGNRLYDGPQELGAFVSAAGGVSTAVDPNIAKPYADEYDASVEHQFWGESSVRVAYVRKNTYNEIATIDLSRLGHFNVPVTRTVPTSRIVLRLRRSSSTSSRARGSALFWQFRCWARTGRLASAMRRLRFSTRRRGSSSRRGTRSARHSSARSRS